MMNTNISGNNGNGAGTNLPGLMARKASTRSPKFAESMEDVVAAIYINEDHFEDGVPAGTVFQSVFPNRPSTIKGAPTSEKNYFDRLIKLAESKDMIRMVRQSGWNKVRFFLLTDSYRRSLEGKTNNPAPKQRYEAPFSVLKELGCTRDSILATVAGLNNELGRGVVAHEVLAKIAPEVAPFAQDGKTRTRELKAIYNQMVYLTTTGKMTAERSILFPHQKEYTAVKRPRTKSTTPKEGRIIIQKPRKGFFARMFERVFGYSLVKAKSR
jgi:hypothetical protein